MSHFAVLVVGDNIENQLAPYNENLETPRYVKYTKEELIEKGKKDIENYKNTTYQEYLNDPEKYIKKCKNNDHIKYLQDEFPNKLNWTNEEIYKEEIKYYEQEEIGENGEVYSEYNPNSKWDWYTIGGRYSQLLKLKDLTVESYSDKHVLDYPSLYGKTKMNIGFADSVKKGDIDWDYMHNNPEKFDKACRYWELKVEGQTPKNEKEKEMLKYDLYSAEYFLKRYKDKVTYAKCNSKFVMWAIVIDGKWIEKGEMGWWACSSETDDEAVDWELNFYDRFIKDLSDDKLLTLVDCHI